jgi:hypothetical protein
MIVNTTIPACAKNERTLCALVVLECLEASKGSASGDHLMAKARLVLVELVVVVDTLVVIFVLICVEGKSVYCACGVLGAKWPTPETHDGGWIVCSMIEKLCAVYESREER